MPGYRVCRVPDRAGLVVHHIGAGGRERPLVSGHVAESSEAPSAAALAILGDALRGDFPRAWRLADAFEREFLSGDFDERTIDASAIDQWIARRARA